MILAEAGGSPGGRPRLGKAPLQSQRSDRLGLRVTGGHDPTGGSTGHPLAHRWLSPISRKWVGQPWRTFETLLGDLRGTTTTTGVRVTASWLEGVYQTGTRVAKAVMKTRQVEPHAVCPRWN